MSVDQVSVDDCSKNSRLRWLYGKFEVVILSAMLLLVAITQRLGFKVAGYGLGATPFLMILFSVLGSVPLNTVLYLYMVKRTGGVLPEYRTWRYFRDYWIIATLNVGNGLAIMWANPYVSGYTQALISNAAIPMTMLLSVICFRTRFSKAAVGGVCLILVGLLAVSGSPSSGDGSKSSLMWTGVFLIAQLPLSAACIYQEAAFRESLNMVHYIHYVTLFLLVDLVVAVPLDTTFGDARSFKGFIDNVSTSWQCVAGAGPPECDGAGIALACYILSMNAGNLFQALLIKRVDATWYMVVLSLSTPLAALSFASPLIVGKLHAESLDSGAIIATALVGLGTIIYRLGSLSSQTLEEDPPSLGYKPFDGEPASPAMRHTHIGVQTDISVGPELQTIASMLEAFMQCERDKRPKPKVIAAGVGLFASEYTNDTKNPMSLFDEKTFRELESRTREPSESPERNWRRTRSESPSSSRDRQISA